MRPIPNPSTHWLGRELPSCSFTVEFDLSLLKIESLKRENQDLTMVSGTENTVSITAAERLLPVP